MHLQENTLKPIELSPVDYPTTSEIFCHVASRRPQTVSAMQNTAQTLCMKLELAHVPCHSKCALLTKDVQVLTSTDVLNDFYGGCVPIPCMKQDN